jgi:hypothetical protein
VAAGVAARSRPRPPPRGPLEGESVGRAEQLVGGAIRRVHAAQAVDQQDRLVPVVEGVGRGGASGA